MAESAVMYCRGLETHILSIYVRELAGPLLHSGGRKRLPRPEGLVQHVARDAVLQLGPHERGSLSRLDVHELCSGIASCDSCSSLGPPNRRPLP